MVEGQPSFTREVEAPLAQSSAARGVYPGIVSSARGLCQSYTVHSMTPLLPYAFLSSEGLPKVFFSVTGLVSDELGKKESSLPQIYSLKVVLIVCN